MRSNTWGVVACLAMLFGAVTSGQVAPDARQFATQAMLANKAEIKLGELALERAQNSEVKNFAQMMVKDHTKGLDDLKQAVKDQGIDEPTELSATHRALYDRLNKLNGAEFDREYMTAMVDAHRNVKAMVETRANKAPEVTGTAGRAGDNAALASAVNAWATRTLPGVTKHLQMAEQVNSKVK